MYSNTPRPVRKCESLETDKFFGGTLKGSSLGHTRTHAAERDVLRLFVDTLKHLQLFS